MSDVKGHDRAASLRPSIPHTYGLTFNYIQAHLAKWLRQYGPAGVLALRWELNDDGRHEPTLRPQSATPRGAASMPDYPITYTYHLTHVHATVPALPTLGASAPTYELARVRIAEAIALHFQPDETDGPLPTVLDACPCPDCDTQILWTVLDDVRTAWSVHQCPRSGGKPL